MKNALQAIAFLMILAVQFGCSRDSNTGEAPPTVAIISDGVAADSDQDKAEQQIDALGGEVKRDKTGKNIIAVDFRSTLRGEIRDDDDLKCLASLTELEELNLPHAKVTGAGFAHLSGLKRLRKVRLLGSKVTDEGIAQLAVLPGLTDLNVDLTDISDAGLKKICDSTGLEVLNIGINKNITDEGLAHLKKLTRLRDLAISCEKMTDGGIEHLRRLSTLEVLELGTAGLTDRGVARLGELKHLRALTLESTIVSPKMAITDEGMACLLSFPALREVELRGRPYTDRALEIVARMDKLEAFGVSYSPATNAGIAHVTKAHPELRKLKIGENRNITGASLKSVANCHNLETLNLWIMREVTAADLASLRDLKKLRVLDLDVREPKVTDAGLAHLADLTDLEELNLFSQNVTDEGLQHLKKLSALRKLDIRDTKVTRQGADRMQKTVPDLKMLFSTE
jgi:Leucine Rich repeat